MTAAAAPASLTRRVAGQGALLLGGLGAAQALSFARNALLGHALSRGDFGIAATITLLLQMIDALSDLGADRLLVQAPDGDDARLQANAHVVLLGRGLLTSLVMLAVAGPMATYFRVESALWAFQIAAVVPLIRGFQHLDVRRAQRRLDNRGGMLVEVIPQALALLLAVPLLRFDAGYGAVVWLALAQAVAAVAVSHALAERRYQLAIDGEALSRFISFGWPILASALPLAAIYQGDRIVIGRLLGMEALAGYSSAFMLTMVPGLLAAKVANALMLPLLAEAHREGHEFAGRYRVMCDATLLGAALYLAGFVIAGGHVLALAFGPNYAGLGACVGWLALMWAVRMLQAVPGMALMATGRTRPLFVAGLLRAAALLPAGLAAAYGLGLEGVAAAGCAGELASLVYVALCCNRIAPGLASVLLTRALLLVPVSLFALSVVRALGPAAGTTIALLAAGLACATLAGVAYVMSPALRAGVRPGGAVAFAAPAT